MRTDPQRCTQVPALAEGEVHVWIAAIEPKRSRSVLRRILASYLDVDPQDLRFEFAEHGKPRLLDPAKLRFNVSHSGALCLYAVALDVELGIDVEAIGRKRDFLAVAARVFGEDERERLAGLEPQRREREFLRLWTSHEAGLKCLGTGLRASDEARRDYRCWSASIDVGEDAIAWLAAAARPATVAVRRWRCA